MLPKINSCMTHAHLNSENILLWTVSEMAIVLSRENPKWIFKTMSILHDWKKPLGNLGYLTKQIWIKTLANLCKIIFIVLSWVILLGLLVRVTQLQPFLSGRVLLFVCRAKENLRLWKQHFRDVTHHLMDARATKIHFILTSSCNASNLYS